MDSIRSKSSGDKFAQEVHFLSIKDRRDFELLYDTYCSSLYNIVLKILKTENSAGEILQYSFLKIRMRFSDYNPQKQHLFTWMVKIVKAAAKNKILFQKHVETLMCLEKTDSVLKEADNRMRETKFSNDPEGMLSLVFFECYTPQQISEKLEIPLNTVKSQLRAGLKKFRKDK